MSGLGKHIQRLELSEDVTATCQKPDIPRLRCGIAGDVDDPIRMKGCRRVQGSIAAALPRRIEQDYVRGATAVQEFIPKENVHIPV